MQARSNFFYENTKCFHLLCGIPHLLSSQALRHKKPTAVDKIVLVVQHDLLSVRSWQCLSANCRFLQRENVAEISLNIAAVFQNTLLPPQQRFATNRVENITTIMDDVE